MTVPLYAKATRLVAPPASRVFSILCDYLVGHPSFLPRGLERLTVEHGGRGAGTAIRFRVRSFGTVRPVRASVDEPEQGRVLVERSLDGSAVGWRWASCATHDLP